MLRIEAISKRASFRLVLRKKVTVIRGDSGTGKTRLVSALINDKGTFKITVSDSRFLFFEVRGSGWYGSLSDSVDSKVFRYVFLIDDKNLLRSKELARIISSDKRNYYIFIDRASDLGMHSLCTVPFSVDEVYELLSDNSGRNHYLSPYYKL